MADHRLLITTGTSRKSFDWQRLPIEISAFFDRLKTPVRGTETLKEYMGMKKAQQDDLKDVGGFVAGTLEGRRRKANAVTGRSAVTLDFDNIPANGTENILQKVRALGICYCVYSTRKHSANAPRLRLIFPADRTMTPDEYEPVARRLAAYIDISAADPTTFEVSRLMYWPSCCADSEFIHEDNRDAKCFSVDGILSTYTGWRDISEWPVVPGTALDKPLKASKQGDPESKTGIVGAFCKTYDIYRAMDELITGIYEPCENEKDRYTYAGGSTTGGAIVYDNGKFLYSHHATDPCSGRLVNSFDLVRLHKYGKMDDDAEDGTPTIKLPSTAEMMKYVQTLPEVVEAFNRQRWEEAQSDFQGISGTCDSENTLEAVGWMGRLKASANGGYQSTIENFSTALEYDPRLSGRIWMNAFSGEPHGTAPLPWGSRAKTEGDFVWTDADDAGLRSYLEKLLKIDARGKLEAALAEHLQRHSVNPVQDYIKGLKWDSVKRLDTLFIDYLGAKDSEYTRVVTRKAFMAAVARAMNPGCKFDNMLILCGPQGIGKSTILSLLATAPKCAGLFNDSIRTFEGKEAAELIQGVWLVEIAELNAFQRSDVDRIKQFLSLCADTYRAAYAHRTMQRPRRCVFFGTCNTYDFLRDPTGNRRFWPVDVSAGNWTEEKQEKLLSERDQIWAEAWARYVVGEPLYLSGEAEEQARKQQEAHTESDPLEGRIADFLERPIPADWDAYSSDKRQLFWNGGITKKPEELVRRERVCAVEVMRELLNLPVALCDRRRSKDINNALQRLGWKRIETPRKFGVYGTQKGFQRF